MDCVRHWASKEDKYPHIFTHKKCWQNQHKLFNLLKSKTRIILTSNHLSLCKEGTTGTFWYQHLVLTLYTFYKKSCQKVKLAAGTLFGRIHQFNFRHLQLQLSLSLYLSYRHSPGTLENSGSASCISRIIQRGLTYVLLIHEDIQYHILNPSPTYY